MYSSEKLNVIQKTRSNPFSGSGTVLMEGLSGLEVKFSGKIVNVDLGERSYPIYVGAGVLGQIGPYFEQHCGQKRAVVITDDNVEPLYGQTVLSSLQDKNLEAHLISVPAGEKTKRMEIVEMLFDRLFDLNVERSDAIIALGGGVIGDLAGFVAATFKRGLNYVQIPTSLLAMVDSSIGGKTGINHPRGKNMIGAFHQPKMVFADINTLKTLPGRELGCGLAETVKHAVIRDAEFFTHISKQTQFILDLDQNLMVDLVVRNCEIKASVVSADERESGLRGILNLGHTIGHAIETVWAVQGGDIHHGEAVALGMVAAGRLAIERGLLTQDDLDRIGTLLASFRLPVRISQSVGPGFAKATPGEPRPTLQEMPGGLREIPVDEMYEAMRQDKKVQSGKIKFVLPKGIGDCVFADDLTEAEIKQAIESLGEE
jgi:3-dehydroquinate synthase